jgi:hypothetical protein
MLTNEQKDNLLQMQLKTRDNIRAALKNGCLIELDKVGVDNTCIDELNDAVQTVLEVVFQYREAIDEEGKDIIAAALRFYTGRIVAIGYTKLMGAFDVIEIVYDRNTVGRKCKPDAQYGVMAYCYNITEPDFSEGGSVFYQKTDLGYKRIA